MKEFAMGSYEYGNMLANVFWGVVLMWGIWKCSQIAKRETTCSKCVQGLQLTLIGLLVGVVDIMPRQIIPHGSVLGILIFAAMLILMISGAVVAIIGLTEYKKQPGYTQGRAQAITAITLSVISLTLMIFGFYLGFSKRLQTLPSTSGMELPTASGTTREFKELNFKFKVPQKPWVEVNAKKINRDAAFALTNGNLQTFFMIIAEKVGIEKDISASTLAEVSRGNLRGVSNSITFSDEKSQTVNGLTGLRFSGDAQIRNQYITYDFWLCSHNGFFYQLIAFGRTSQKAILFKEVDKLLNNFEQVDKNKVFYANPDQQFTVFTSEAFNYSVDLTGTPWKKWAVPDEDMPNEEIRGIQDDETWFGIVPFYFGKESIDLDTLTHVLLEAQGFEFPGKHIENLTPIKESGMKGYRFDFKRNIDGKDYIYHNKTVQGKECGYLVMFSAPYNNAVSKPLAEQVFAAVRFPDLQPSGLDPNTFPQKLKASHATLINQLGVYYYNAKQFHKSLAPFKTAIRLRPQDRVILVNLLMALNELKRYKEGVEIIDSYASFYKEDKDMGAWKATFLARDGRTSEAIDLFQQLFKKNFKNDEDFNYYIGLLAAEKKWDQAHAAFNEYLKQNDSLQLRLDHANLFYQEGKYREAIQRLKEEQKQVPFNPRIAYALIRNYSELGEYNEGLNQCQQLIDKGFASKDAYNEKGTLEYNLKWYRKAKESFEKALSFAPNDQGILDDLKYISGLLGEGNNSVLKTAIEAVPLPEAVKTHLPPLTAPAPEQGTSAYYLWNVEVLRYQAGKGTTISGYKAIKVIDSGGISRFSTLELDFNPLAENVFVNSLVVLDSEGKEIAKGKPSDYYVIDKKEGEMATHDQTLHIPVPNLLPGSIIKLTWTRERPGDKNGFSFYFSTLSSVQPVIFSGRYLTGDIQRLVSRVDNGVKELKLADGTLLYMNTPPVYEWESEQAPYVNFLPMVWLCDASLTWESEGKQYLEDIREKMVMEPQVEELAKKLTAGLTANREKIDALARYLQKTYTYKAIEFGKRARIPNKASQIIANKYGDCKDHALLLHQLLKVVNIPAYLALVSSDLDIIPQLCSTEQFNHVILYIPPDPGTSDGSGRFIDATDKNLDLRMAVPANLGGKHSLILDPGNFRLMKIPDYEPDSSSVSIQKWVQIVKPKEMQVKETVKITGYSASFMREYLKWYDTGKQSQWAHNFISSYLDAFELKTFKVNQLDDNSQPLLLELDYTVKEQTETPNAWEAYYLEASSVKERKTPFRLNYPFKLESQCTVTAPQGYTLSIKTGDKPQTQQNTMANWESRVKNTPRQVDLYLKCTLHPGHYDPAQYPVYQTMMSKAAKAMTIDLDCKK